LGKVRDTLSGLRQELRGNHEDLAELKSEIREVKRANTVKQLEEQLSAANHAVGAIRQELHDLATKFETQLDSLRQNTKDIDELRSLARDRVTARDHAKDMAAVRGELAQLRKQMDEGRAKPPSAFPARELDILTSNIAKIGNRASLVESLQMEFEIFKGRVERMEAAAAQSSQGQTTAPTTTASAYDRYDDHDYHPQELRSSRRKRPSSGLDTSPLPDLSSKRAAASSDMTADTITATHWTDSSPVTESRTRPDTTRQTKGGRVEKPQRPPRRSLIGENTQSKRKG
jgi:predicted  nucleic acid-binding Zn-ribbon protein